MLLFFQKIQYKSSFPVCIRETLFDFVSFLKPFEIIGIRRKLDFFLITRWILQLKNVPLLTLFYYDIFPLERYCRDLHRPHYNDCCFQHVDVFCSFTSTFSFNSLGRFIRHCLDHHDCIVTSSSSFQKSQSIILTLLWRNVHGCVWIALLLLIPNIVPNCKYCQRYANFRQRG